MYFDVIRQPAEIQTKGKNYIELQDKIYIINKRFFQFYLKEKFKFVMDFFFSLFNSEKQLVWGHLQNQKTRRNR